MQKEFIILIENTPEAIFIQVNGKFAYINPAGLKLFGAKYKEEIIGHNIIERVDPAFHEKVLERIHILNHERLPVEIMEQIYYRIDGTKLFVEVSATPFVFNGEKGSLSFIRNITQVKESEQRYKDLFSKMPDGFLVCEVEYGTDYMPRDLRITKLNVSAAQLIEKNIDELQDKLLSSLYLKGIESINLYRGKLIEILNGKNIIQEIPLIYTNKEKKVKIHAYSSAPDQIALILEDVTQVRLNEENLKLAKDRAEESDRLKASILENLNHEIRTPMNAILGFSDMILTESRNKDIKQCANRIKLAGNRLFKTLNDMIDLSMIEAEFKHKKPEVIEIYDEIVGLYPIYKSLCNEKKLKFTFNSDYQIQVYVPRDIFIITLKHLIDNAIKFTDSGGVHIETRIFIDEQGEWADVAVKDTGIGIDPKSHNLIFEAFTQISRGYDRIYEGTGIGLTIAKKMANLMNGIIKVDSEIGGGSEFTLRLPLFKNYNH